MGRSMVFNSITKVNNLANYQYCKNYLLHYLCLNTDYTPQPILLFWLNTPTLVLQQHIQNKQQTQPSHPCVAATHVEQAINAAVSSFLLK